MTRTTSTLFLLALEEDGITAVIDCSAVPGPDAQD